MTDIVPHCPRCRGTGKDMTKDQQPYIFISYSHDDADFAEGFSKRLQQARIPHFRDTKAIEWGGNIPEQIHSALERTTHLLSPT
jgi:hypothetical protein